MTSVLNNEHTHDGNFCQACSQVKNIWGDVDSNGIVDARDVVNLKKRLAAQSDKNNSRIDLNNDGVVDSADLSTLRDHFMN